VGIKTGADAHPPRKHGGEVGGTGSVLFVTGQEQGDIGVSSEGSEVNIGMKK